MDKRFLFFSDVFSGFRGNATAVVDLVPSPLDLSAGTMSVLLRVVPS